MGGGNGAKAQQKRERNVKKAGGKSHADPKKLTTPMEKCNFVNKKTGVACQVMLLEGRTNKSQMEAHVASAHPGEKVEAMFPKSYAS